MSDRNRLPYFAIGLGVALGLLLTFQSVYGGGGGNTGERHPTAAAYQNRDGEEFSALGPCTQDGVDTALDGRPTECDAHYYERRDLRQQTSMAVAAWSQFGLNVVSIILLGVTLNLSIGATRAAIRQGDIAHKQYVAESRPRFLVDELLLGDLAVAMVAAPIQNLPEGMTGDHRPVPFNFRLQNHGRGIGTIIRRSFIVEILDRDSLPGDARHQAVDNSHSRLTIPPGGSVFSLRESPPTMYLTPGEIEKLQRGDRWLCVFVFMRYEAIGQGPYTHRSAHRYEVEGKRFVPYDDARFWEEKDESEQREASRAPMWRRVWRAIVE